MKQRFSEVYCQVCQAVEASIQEKLGRPLTQREQSSIWNAGSLLLLESCERAILAAQSPEEAALLLSQQAALAEDRLQQAKEQMLQRLKELLQRDLSEQEESQLQAIKAVKDVMCLAEQVSETPEFEREMEFHTLLTNLQRAQ